MFIQEYDSSLFDGTIMTIPCGVNSFAKESVDVQIEGYYNSGGTVEKIVIPYTVTSFGQGAFSNLQDLKTVEFQTNELTDIASEGFANCSQLQQITIPDTVIAIGDYAFQNCTSLRSINIPPEAYINRGAFSGCTALECVCIYDATKQGDYTEFQLGNISMDIVHYGEAERCEEYYIDIKGNGLSGGAIAGIVIAVIVVVAVVVGIIIYVCLKKKKQQSNDGVQQRGKQQMN